MCYIVLNSYTQILETLSQASPYQILSLVTYKGSSACFSFLSLRSPPLSFSDLTLQTAVPIDKQLECKIGICYIIMSHLGMIKFSIMF